MTFGDSSVECAGVYRELNHPAQNPRDPPNPGSGNAREGRRCKMLIKRIFWNIERLRERLKDMTTNIIYLILVQLFLFIFNKAQSTLNLQNMVTVWFVGFFWEITFDIFIVNLNILKIKRDTIVLVIVVYWYKKGRLES